VTYQLQNAESYFRSLFYRCLYRDIRFLAQNSFFNTLGIHCQWFGRTLYRTSKCVAKPSKWRFSMMQVLGKSHFEVWEKVRLDVRSGPPTVGVRQPPVASRPLHLPTGRWHPRHYSVIACSSITISSPSRASLFLLKVSLNWWWQLFYKIDLRDFNAVLCPAMILFKNLIDFFNNLFFKIWRLDSFSSFAV